MKVLRLVNSGLIKHHICPNPITSPLDDNATYTSSTDSIVLNSGSIDFNSSSYSEVVFEIRNDFIPSSVSDLGGIRIKAGQEVREFFEYDASGSTPLPYIRVVKNGDVFTGFSADVGGEWVNKGSINFPFSESMSMAVYNGVAYRLYEIKIFKQPYVTIYSVLPNWTVRAVAPSGAIVKEVVSTSNSARLFIPHYPFNGSIKIYDEHMLLVCDYDVADLWGGDEFVTTADVELYDRDFNLITTTQPTDLGSLYDGFIEDYFYVHNKSSDIQDIKIRVANNSVFKDWVWLAKDVAGLPDTYGTNVSFSLAPNTYETFWMMVTKPTTFPTTFDIDYRNTSCVFYLEVE